jgi:hypothetical protein
MSRISAQFWPFLGRLLQLFSKIILFGLKSKVEVNAHSSQEFSDSSLIPSPEYLSPSVPGRGGPKRFGGLRGISRH